MNDIQPHDREKKEFRETAKAARLRAVAEAGTEASLDLGDHLWKAFGGLEPGAVISGYLAIANELDVLPAMERFHEAGLCCVLPVVEGPERPLIFRRWRPGVDLEDGPFKTRHPGPANERLDPDVLMIPLLAFDREGYRLGWGGGFYDRTLDDLRGRARPVAVGIAYSGQEFERVPRGPYDEALDWIATERGATKFGDPG